MTRDDDSLTAVKLSRGGIQPKDIQGPSHDVPTEKHSMEVAFESALLAKTFMWLHLPWIGSVVIMTIAVLVYFYVHPWPDSFTEAVLGIIVGGAAVTGGSTTFNLLYKTKSTN